MISEERLKELIEQEEIVYDPDIMWEEVGELKLNKTMKVVDGKLCGDIIEEGLPSICKMFCSVPLNDLFETKEEAEWHREFGCIERVERLELPTWEEFDKSEKLVRFIGKNGGKCKLEGYFNLDLQNGFIDIVENGSSQLNLSEYTKENYTLACRKAKELFLGE